MLVPIAGWRGRSVEKSRNCADHRDDPYLRARPSQGGRQKNHGALMTELKQPHDALCKKTFSVVEHAAAELRAVLPPELVARIDFSTLTLRPASHVDEALSASHSDLLFSVRVSGKPALLFERPGGATHDLSLYCPGSR